MAGVRCTVCDHAERKAIEAALAVSSERSIAKQWGLSDSAVHRHKTRHLTPAVVRAAARRESVGAEALLERLQELTEKLQSLFDDAHQKRDHAAAARIAKELRETVVRLGQATRGMWGTTPATIVDNRRQTLVNLSGLSTDELRSLATLAACGRLMPAADVAVDARFTELPDADLPLNP